MLTPQRRRQAHPESGFPKDYRIYAVALLCCSIAALPAEMAPHAPWPPEEALAVWRSAFDEASEAGDGVATWSSLLAAAQQAGAAGVSHHSHLGLDGELRIVDFLARLVNLWKG